MIANHSLVCTSALTARECEVGASGYSRGASDWMSCSTWMAAKDVSLGMIHILPQGADSSCYPAACDTCTSSTISWAIHSTSPTATITRNALVVSPEHR